VRNTPPRQTCPASHTTSGVDWARPRLLDRFFISSTASSSRARAPARTPGLGVVPIRLIIARTRQALLDWQLFSRAARVDGSPPIWLRSGLEPAPNVIVSPHLFDRVREGPYERAG
jgi:hypothetical protein